MQLQAFTAKWFALYYPILGLLFLCLGIYVLLKPETAACYLLDHSSAEQPPPLLRAMLKYFFLFTLPGLLFSFFPFSWTELLFSLWSLVIIYVAGIPLIHWSPIRVAFKNNLPKTRSTLKMTGAAMVAVSAGIFLLGYLVIQQFFSHR